MKIVNHTPRAMGNQGKVLNRLGGNSLLFKRSFHSMEM